jgi:hypothetical protein
MIMKATAALWYAIALLGALTGQRASAHLVHLSDKPRLSVTIASEHMIYEAVFPISV